MCLAISLSSALDEFDDVSVWVFDHGDACVRQNLRLRRGELTPFSSSTVHTPLRSRITKLRHRMPSFLSKPMGPAGGTCLGSIRLTGLVP